MSPKDWDILDKIELAYDQSIKLNSPVGLPLYPSTRKLSSITELINEPMNIYSTRLVTYFKQLPEFYELEEDDKLTLIKYNLFGLIFIRGILIYDPINDTYQEYGTSDCVFNVKDLLQSCRLYLKSTDSRRSFSDIVECDRLVVKVILIIMLFSKGSSMCSFKHPEPILKNNIQIYKSQNFYIELVWKYCEQKFGFLNGVKLFLRLVTCCMVAKMAAEEMQQYVENTLTECELAPLMQSIIFLS
ncbi:unnamed protein product [Didymodactylos carnosus]|uniref:NR LBD domain-containing protein n=1 Tax=Didymodactylos carnosus TaxID=1234261 RepID=A0A8S2WS59_9BILA|nr:unnamed protein product [Didymodactylos carnosus]